LTSISLAFDLTILLQTEFDQRLLEEQDALVVLLDLSL